MSISERALGRIAFDDVKHPLTGEIIIKKSSMIDEAACDLIDSAGIKSIKVYSVMTCVQKKVFVRSLMAETYQEVKWFMLVKQSEHICTVNWRTWHTINDENIPCRWNRFCETGFSNNNKDRWNFKNN